MFEITCERALCEPFSSRDVMLINLHPDLDLDLWI